MTLWISENPVRKSSKRDMALNAVNRLETAILTKEQAASPEWKAVREAVQEKNRMVISVGLEVLISHYKDRFTSAARQMFAALAESIRASRHSRTLALIELLTRRPQSFRAA